jgi:microsomal dipeptidase-like Zn-dependent dipeptidase
MKERKDMSVADFHCDLLSYLAEDVTRTPYDPESRASIPFLVEGGVILETLAIFTKTKKGSALLGEKQFQIFMDLPKKHPDVFGDRIKLVLAIENASSFCEEGEHLQEGIKRLTYFLKKAGKIAYISLTWNGENRFGGGSGSKVGLKPDGETLLEWMSGKGVGIDFSHTSDKLAHDIFHYIDKRQLKITPVASHSNFRSLSNHERNLPDAVAKEIGSRKGIIGLNFVRRFLGSQGPSDFLEQVDLAQNLGLMGHMCLGADFFDDRDFPPEYDDLRPLFNPGFDTAACYPKLLDLLKEQLHPSEIEGLFHRNLTDFIQRDS